MNGYLNKQKYFINPTGRFVIGGPMGDCGLTGVKSLSIHTVVRLVMVVAHFLVKIHQSRPFSGLCSTLCGKNIVAAGLADRCEIQLSYAIGVAEPTSIMVETFGTGKVSNEVLVKLVREFFDLRPYGLIKMLNLIQPIYRQTAAYGHFGREQFPWEK